MGSTPRNILKPRTPRNTSTEISKESESIAPSSESSLLLKLRNASLERRRLTSWKSKLPEVKELKVSSRDSVSPDFQERLEEVSERSLVLVPGIHLQSSGLSPELVISVTSIELTLTTRS